MVARCKSLDHWDSHLRHGLVPACRFLCCSVQVEGLATGRFPSKYSFQMWKEDLEALMMDAVSFSEMLVTDLRTSWCIVPEDNHLGLEQFQ